ncbi:MAG TPA: hypothetical protein VFD55_00130, partial [Candidatus Angelobacter sp.]|nr:hypothetical protein [Candidatus Angelobacter sp.]
PQVQYGTFVLVDINYPTIIEKVWSIFRASARLFWPIYYLIIIGILAFLIKLSNKLNKKVFIIFLFMLLSIQFIDVYFSQSATVKRSDFSSHQTTLYEPPLDLALWKQVSFGSSHMIYLDDMSGEDFFELVDVALQNNLTMNTGYYARKPGKLIQDYQDKQRELLTTGNTDISSNLFITKDELFVNQLQATHKYTIKYIDGFYVIR